MIATRTIAELGHVAYRIEDVYREVDVPHGLDYCRRVGVLRLAQVLEDQLALDENDALVLAAAMVSVGDAEA